MSIADDRRAQSQSRCVRRCEDEFELVREACRAFDLQAFREGHLTPVFFGSRAARISASAICSSARHASRRRRARSRRDKRIVDAEEPRMTGLRVQDPGQHGSEPPRPHRVRAAMLGQADARHEGQADPHRQDRCALNAPQFFFAKDRAIADEAYAGDVVGIPNHGTLRIGDTLTEGEDLNFVGVPSFAPEILRRVRLGRCDEGQEAEARRCSRWRRRAWCRCSARMTARPRWSAWSVRCSSMCCSVRLEDEYGLEVGFDAERIRAGALDFVGRAKASSTPS